LSEQFFRIDKWNVWRIETQSSRNRSRAWGCYEAMLAAYRMACDAPQLRFTADARTLMVADKIIDLALAGETDAERLCAGALRRLSH
jgi:hypothetical protein